MAITHVGDSTAISAGLSGLTQTNTYTSTDGNTLVVYASGYISGNTALSLASVSDTASNTWTVVQGAEGFFSGSSYSGACAVAFCVNASAVTSVTIHWSAIPGVNSFMQVSEFAGVPAGAGLDGNSALSFPATSVSSQVTPTVTPTATTNIMIGNVACNAEWSTATPGTLINNGLAAWQIITAPGVGYSDTFSGVSNNILATQTVAIGLPVSAAIYTGHAQFPPSHLVGYKHTGQVAVPRQVAYMPPPPFLPVYNYFTGASSGTTITTGNSGGPGNTPFNLVTIGSGATVQFSNAEVPIGSTGSMDLSTVGAALAYVEWTSVALGTNTSTVYFRMYLYFTATPAANFPIITFLTGSGAGCAQIWMNTSGMPFAHDAAGAGAGITFTNAVNLNSWSRIEGFISPSTTTGVISISLYNSPQSTTPTETEFVTSKVLGANIGIAQFGVTGSVASIGPFWMGNIALAASAVGPVVQQFTSTLTAVTVVTSGILKNILKTLLYGGWIDWFSMTPGWMTPGGTAPGQPVGNQNRGLSVSASVNRQPQKPLTATVAAYSAVINKIQRALIALAVVYGTVARKVSRSIAAILIADASAATTRALRAVIVATAIVTASTQRTIGRILAAVATVTGATGRSISRTITAATVATGSVRRVFARTVTATMVLTGGVLRTAGRSLSSVTVVTVSVTRRVDKVVTGVTIIGAFTGRLCSRTISSVVIATGSVTRRILRTLISSAIVYAAMNTGASITHLITVAGQLVVTAATRNTVSRFIAAQTIVTASETMKLSRTVAAQIVVTANSVKGVLRKLNVTVITTASMTLTKVHMVVLQAFTVINSALIRKILPNIVAVVILGSVTIRGVSRAIQGTFVVAGQTLRTTGRVIASVIVATVTVTGRPGKVFNSTVSVTVAVTSKIGKLISATTTITGSSATLARHFLSFITQTVFSAAISGTRLVTLTAVFTVTTSVTVQFFARVPAIIFKVGLVTTRWFTSSVKNLWKSGQ